MAGCVDTGQTGGAVVTADAATGAADANVGLHDATASPQVDWHLDIVDNETLSDISALSGVEGVGGDLFIKDNPALMTCDAQSVAGALGDDVVGRVEISGNAPGCRAVLGDVDFARVYQEVIAPAGCSGGYCHGSVMTDRERILAGVSDDDECDKLRWVVPGAPESSLLWLKIAPGVAVCGPKMPKDGPPLSQEQADLIFAWIAQGAN